MYTPIQNDVMITLQRTKIKYKYALNILHKIYVLLYTFNKIFIFNSKIYKKQQCKLKIIPIQVWYIPIIFIKNLMPSGINSQEFAQQQTLKEFSSKNSLKILAKIFYIYTFMRDSAHIIVSFGIHPL